MFQTSKTSNTMQTANYFVREHRGGNPQIIRCSPPRGYPTATAAREAKIKEIEEQIRFCCETINGKDSLSARPVTSKSRSQAHPKSSP
jgi:hypothetical protein